MRYGLVKHQLNDNYNNRFFERKGNKASARLRTFTAYSDAKRKKTQPETANWVKDYKGAMAKQPLNDIDRQLNELRSE